MYVYVRETILKKKLATFANFSYRLCTKTVHRVHLHRQSGNLTDWPPTYFHRFLFVTEQI